MQGFTGFPDSKQRLTSIPNLFFSEVMPAIKDVAELKVTLYLFWALTQQDRPIRFLRRSDFLQDQILMDGFGSSPTIAAETLSRGLELAVQRGTLLHIRIEGADHVDDYYFVNSAKGRAAVEGLVRGKWRPNQDLGDAVTLLVERPNVFTLYEQNIGALTPMIAEELKDAEREYPIRWIEEAINIAVKNNVRKWRYVRGVLERWRTEGKDSGVNRRNSETQRSQQLPDQFKDIIER
jgi:DnaD/phage-associated family protein